MNPAVSARMQAVLDVLIPAQEPLPCLQVAKLVDLDYTQTYQALVGLHRQGLVERVTGEALCREVEFDGRTLRMAPHAGTVAWRAVKQVDVDALEAAWTAPEASDRVEAAPRPLGPVEKLTALRDRVLTASDVAERAPLSRELKRIAEALDDLRDEVIALIVEGSKLRTVDLTSNPVDLTSNRNRRVRAKNPAPGMRKCSKCRSVLPVEMFTVTDAKTGKRRADCKICYNDRQRTRYVRAGFKIVTIEVLDGDACVGHPCPSCGKPFEVGQLVQGDDVRHHDCAPVAVTR